MIYRLIKKIHSILPLKTILVIGDSHVLVFNHKLFVKNMPLFKFNVVSVPGATASGLVNPNSKTQAYKIFRTHIEKNNYKKIILCLGEVDTGFVIWYRAQKHQDYIESMFKQAVNNYLKLIEECNGKAKTIVLSAPLPTISDNSNMGEVANQRKVVNVNQIDRTELTIKFNREVEETCKKSLIEYINLDSDSINRKGVIKSNLRSKDDTDHHYDETAYATLLLKFLRLVI